MKKISLSFGAVCADVYFFPGGAVRSLLLLEPVQRDLSRLPLYRKDGAFLTAVSGMDWERDMTRRSSFRRRGGGISRLPPAKGAAGSGSRRRGRAG